MDLDTLPTEGLLKDTDRLVRVTQQLSDLKTLSQPDQSNSSPVPGQMRVAPDSVAAPGVDTKVMFSYDCTQIAFQMCLL